VSSRDEHAGLAEESERLSEGLKSCHQLVEKYRPLIAGGPAAGHAEAENSDVPQPPLID
jgi:hypothetical protein